MAVLKLKEEALIKIRENLEPNELEAVDFLLEGKTKYNSVKQCNLEAFRKIINLMSTKLDWNENKVVSDEDLNVQSNDDNQEILTEEALKTEICKFYKNGKCRFGKTGKKPDQQGKVCSNLQKV